MADPKDSTSATARLRESAGALDALPREDLVASIERAQKQRYEIEGLLAQGGMGRIEKVTDRALNRPVVRKCIHEQLAQDAKQSQMFVREARVTGMLSHPCVVPVHDLGVDEQGHLFYTMERVSGRTLEQMIDALPPAPTDRGALFDLLDVVVRVCDALGFAHRSGVLHCDIKPANVMVGEYGQVYLMDWGIARFAEDELAREPGPGGVSGTPTHMSPEQARGERLDARSDVFAVGGLIYQIITRRPPFLGESLIQTLASAILCRVAHPDDVPAARGAPAALTRIALKAMSADRDDRYASASELKDALVRFMRGVDVFPRISFKAGEDIIREGEPGDAAYVIESGTCEVLRAIDGKQRLIRVMEAGEVFGEMAILSPGVRTATVRALENTTLLEITAAALEGELDSMKPWMGALVRTLAARFRERDGKR